ncbi:MAG: hypothetical protein LC792_01240 [Actinobacteria bacterium]|nr:hypothetical protein [Actinomycetota bacterium]
MRGHGSGSARAAGRNFSAGPTASSSPPTTAEATARLARGSAGPLPRIPTVPSPSGLPEDGSGRCAARWAQTPSRLMPNRLLPYWSHR